MLSMVVMAVFLPSLADTITLVNRVCYLLFYCNSKLLIKCDNDISHFPSISGFPLTNVLHLLNPQIQSHDTQHNDI
jgi:hypothetical protein